MPPAFVGYASNNRGLSARDADDPADCTTAGSRYGLRVGDSGNGGITTLASAGQLRLIVIQLRFELRRVIGR